MARLSSTEGLVLRTLARLDEEGEGHLNHHLYSDVARRANLTESAAEAAYAKLSSKGLLELRYRPSGAAMASLTNDGRQAIGVAGKPHLGPRLRLSALAV
jgi:DNA-binding MarR family transcriptional regulator